MGVQRERAELQMLIKLTRERWWAPWLHHSPNEELNATARQLAASMGTRRGFPDLILPLRTDDHVGIAVELKAARPHGRPATAEQKRWLLWFESQGWQVAICYGLEEALPTLANYVAKVRRPGTRARVDSDAAVVP